MKFSVFTTATDPILRGDLWHESIDCYEALADEVVVVNGGGILPLRGFSDHLNIKVVQSPWNHEFSWKFIAEQFQRGYDACTGDWVIRADLDMIFHENDYFAIRKACEENNEAPGLSFLKRQFILPDRFNLKSRLIIAVNKGRYGDRIKFDGGGESDLCAPSVDGKYMAPGTAPETYIPFWNYEKIIKTKSQITEDSGRMDRAYHKQFGKYQLSKDGSDESAFEGYMRMVTGRFSKPNEHVKLEDHPRVMWDVIRGLNPEQFGYSGLSVLGENDYVKASRVA